MRRIWILFLMISVAASAQENLGTIQIGYASGFANISAKQTGIKLNGSWEFQPMGDSWTIGGSIGFIQLNGETPSKTFILTSVPITLVSRLMFGREKLKAYIRGQAGTHFSGVEYSGLLTYKDNNVGVAAGIGGGAMCKINETVFISAEYEWLWLGNLANTSSVGTAAFGVGFRF